jgi:hypothetical protein
MAELSSIQTESILATPDRVFAQQGQGVLDAASGLQGLGALVGNDDVRQRMGLGAAEQMGFQPVGEVVDIDHGGLDPGGGQAVQHVVDQRLAADVDQGLGPVIGERAHAGAQARSQDHGDLGRLVGGRAHRRNSEGTCVSNHAFSPAIAGSSRFRSR